MKNKFFWILIALVLIGGVTYAAWPEIKKAVGDGGSTGGNGNTGGNGGSAAGTGSNGTNGGSTYQTFNLNAVLKLNVYDSKEVKELQRMLNRIEASNQISEDGDFGPLPRQS